MIPRVFHRVWVGEKPIPEEFLAYGESWQRLNPNWEMRQWTEGNLPELLRPEGADPRRDPTERSDLLRYELVRRFGGVYLDMDFECRKPIDELIEGLDFFLGYVVADEFGGQSNLRVGSAIIGAVPGHEILERAVREVEPRGDLGYDKASTGPLFLERLMEDFPDAKRFPVEYLYPQTEEQEEDAYAIHHEARAWLTHEDLNQRVKSLNQKLRRVRERAHRLKQQERSARHDLAKVRAKLEESERRRKELKAELAAARSGVGRRALARIGRARAERSPR